MEQLPSIALFSITTINYLFPYTRIPLEAHFTGSHHFVYLLHNPHNSHFAFIIFTSIEVEIDTDDPAIGHYVLKFRLYYPSRPSIPITYYYPIISVHPEEIQEISSSNLTTDQILQQIFPHSGRQY